MNVNHSKPIKFISTFLAVLFIIEVLPLSVWAKDITDEEKRVEYFNEFFSGTGYLEQIVDTKKSVKIINTD